jgi:hypothetical protein
MADADTVSSKRKRRNFGNATDRPKKPTRELATAEGKICEPVGKIRKRPGDDHGAGIAETDET